MLTTLNSTRLYPILPLTREKRLAEMLAWLEGEGYFLWYNDRMDEWELFPGEDYYENHPENDDYFSLVGADKFKVIEQAFYTLCH